MGTEIIVALISGGSALLVSVATNLMSASSTRKLLEYRMVQLEGKVDKIEGKVDTHNEVMLQTGSKVDRLETKVDKHNEVQDRVMALEYKINNIEYKMKGDDGK